MLIPKEQKPTSIRSFKSISLCNASIKMVTKMIVNRLKQVMSDIISPYQASFIPGRQGINNVVICQEVLHSLRYTNARRGEWY